MRYAIVAALLIGCGPGHVTPRDAGNEDAPRGEDGGLGDAGPRWAQLGCELTPYCIAIDGAYPFCWAVLDDAEHRGDVGACTRWARCPESLDRCFVCLDWSSDPRMVVEAGDVSGLPTCAEQVCPRPDGGVPECRPL